MYRKTILAGLLSVLIWGASCSSRLHLVGVERTRILIDSTFDNTPNKEAWDFVQPYRARIDSMMSPVVGRLAHDMAAYRPESPLSNLLSDILLWAGKNYGEQADFAVYNIGGIRAVLPKGNVCVGDVLEVAPFENKICFVSLTGEKVMELFGQIALQGGEGVSRGVEMKISSDHKLISALLHGKEIIKTEKYRIATIDYVAQGNDQMIAFKSATDIHQPEGEANNVRFVIMDYLREKAKEGVEVAAEKEGRIVVVNP